MTPLNLPWLLIADFNAVVSMDEYKGASHFYYHCKAHKFFDFIALNNLLDMSFIGSNYTRCNNQVGMAK